LIQIAAPDISSNAAKQEYFMHYIKNKNTPPTSQKYEEQNNKPELIECELVRSDSYIETLEIRPIALQGYGLELLIKTQLLTAKKPTEIQYKSKTCIDRSSLIELHSVIEKFLEKSASSLNEPSL
jgi:hypothetical protein